MDGAIDEHTYVFAFGSFAAFHCVEWAFVTAGSWQTDFSRIFIFGPPDFFTEVLAGFFLLVFVGKVPRKILQKKIPGKIL